MLHNARSVPRLSLLLTFDTEGPSQIATSAATYCSDRAAEAGFEGPEVEACARLESAWGTERSSRL